MCSQLGGQDDPTYLERHEAHTASSESPTKAHADPDLVAAGRRLDDTARSAAGGLEGAAAVEGDPVVEVNLVAGLLLGSLKTGQGVRRRVGQDDGGGKADEKRD